MDSLVKLSPPQGREMRRRAAKVHRPERSVQPQNLTFTSQFLRVLLSSLLFSDIFKTTYSNHRLYHTVLNGVGDSDVSVESDIPLIKPSL